MAIREHKFDHYMWIDISQPSREELKEVGANHGLHKFSIEDSLDPDHLPKYEIIDGVIFIIARVYDEHAANTADTIQELTRKVAIFAGKDFVITIHRKEMKWLEDACEAGQSSHEYIFDMLCTVLQKALLTFRPPLIQLDDTLDKHESKVFLKNKTRDLLLDLYHVRRQAAVIKRVLKLTRETLVQLKNHISIERMQAPVHQDLLDLFTRIDTMCDNLNDNANNLVNFYINIASQKTNEVMRILTVFSVFFMPLTFIVGIYGMNFRYMPELEMTIGYPAVLLLMGVITLVIYLWFRKKGWL